MDDRMLLAVMDLLLAGLEPSALQYDLWFAATVQEENGLHGAKALAQRTAFDLVLALDVGLVGDVPTVGEREYPARLGGGPTLVHKDRIIHYDRRFLWQLARVAETHGIPYQHGVYASYSSDGCAFIEHGSPAVLIGVPTRYTHSPVEMVDEGDLVATAALLRAFAATAPAGSGRTGASGRTGGEEGVRPARRAVLQHAASCGVAAT